MTENLNEFADKLRAAGWVVLPPVSAENVLPDPAVGQTWHSAKPGGRIEPRTIVKVGKHSNYPFAEACVYFSIPSDPPDRKFPRVLDIRSFRAWIRNGQCRPDKV